MGDILGLIFSGGFGTVLGGITGLVGTWLKSKHERDMLKLEMDERQKDREHDLSVMKMEGDNAVRVADIHRQEADDTASGKALEKSYSLEPKRYSEGLAFPDTWYGRVLSSLTAVLMFSLDFFRGMMRPGGTLYMMILNTFIYLQYQEMVETYAIKPTPEQAYAITMYFVSSFAYLLTTSFVWWYGDRNRQKPPKTLGT